MNLPQALATAFGHHQAGDVATAEPMYRQIVAHDPQQAPAWHLLGVVVQQQGRATEAIAPLPEVIAPFPGGVVRSGSKVGSQYKKLVASTADAYCPTLRGRVGTKLREGANCALEIVIDGASETAVATAMAAAIRATTGPGVIAIGAGNYGGKLGKFHFHLHRILDGSAVGGAA